MNIPWGKYKSIINAFHNEANQQEVIWHRNTTRRDDFHGEDRPVDAAPDDVTLLALIQYNDFRTWPITKFDITGSLDKQSEVLILNREYLRSNNLLDSNGKFTYDSVKDRFSHHGDIYEDAGSTNTAQASDDPLLLYIILKRVNG